ncbi:ABC transporter ATP-binding protein [Enterococcus sp. HY326]|uniref:ABC transporter ATP-binding protein n=1 Tax=Enterococcus sp. HY326 TaxID=2971265 RepID=UPI00223EDA07|nr:ATP-binding cassette domain-containing protein [Enterococcus sp. HY326]
MIEIENIKKKYGNKVVLDKVSFTAEKGQITGVIGPNGSGKSTLMRILLGLETSQEGQALINKKKYMDLREQPYNIVGSFLDSCSPNPSRTGVSHLRWIGLACGIDKKRCLECLEIVGLTGVGKKKIKDYSLGMKQRLGLAAAILADPQILVLDEPINGLDPEGIRWVRDFLKGFVNQGKLVLMSSHYMSELELTVDKVVALSHGKIVLHSDRDTIISEYGSFENAYFDSTKTKKNGDANVE